MIVMKSERISGLRVFTQKDGRDRTFIVVYKDYVPIVFFYIDNINERRLAAVQLVDNGFCSQKMAGKICGFHPNTVFKLLRAKRLFGIEAIFDDDRGPKGPYKYVNEIRLHIKKLLRKYPEWTDQAIADQASKDLKLDISRSAAARIRTEKQDKKAKRNKLTKAELVKLAAEADRADRRKYDDRQMELNFNWDPEIKKKCEECSKEGAIKPEKETQRSLIEQMQRGCRFNFCGALMHHLFLNEIGFESIACVFPKHETSGYQSIDILLTLFHSINLSVPSIEALKLVNAGELGLLMGMNRSPEKETVRDHLSEMASHYLSGVSIDRFAEALLEQSFINPEVFFIDGHFLPYYGLKIIAKGYFTIRRMAMRGNELYCITDLQGRPLFFITESNEIDFRPIISRTADKLIELGITRPILVFDRGGYGIHFFKQLDETTDFVTWAKYIGDKALANMPDSSFTVGIRRDSKTYLVAEEIRKVTESVQTAKKEGRSEPTSITLRLIVLHDNKTGKRMGIYTNNMCKPLHEIAHYMLNRWGDSENTFKEMTSRFNLDYHPGYDIKELENQPLMDNPDIALIKKAIHILHAEAVELEKEILITEAKENRRPDKRREGKISKLQSLIAEKKQDILGFEDKLTQLPDKVSILDVIGGKPMNRCDLEKKKLYDAMQFMAYNSREKLVELFRECYSDHRDVKKVLDMITGRAGYIKLVGQTLIVVLDWIENNKHRESAEKFCRMLNGKGVKLIGRLNLNLAFFISKTPLHVLKTASQHMHNQI